MPMAFEKRRKKDTASRLADLPPVHRWMLFSGLFLFSIWFLFYFAIAFAESYAPAFTHALAEPAAILFVLSTTCIAFGITCELVLNLVTWNRVRKVEEDRLADLCGRTRFDRPRKKSKIKVVCTNPDESVTS